MFSISGDGAAEFAAGLHVSDGETFEVRYVDDAQAAMWACERGYLFSQDDFTIASAAYPD
jgi:hypothetical protein